MSRRVVMAMSGGVDSSVAALMLSEQGFDVVGVFMSGGLEPPARRRERSCCSGPDAEDAAGVASQIGIPFFRLDCREPFDELMEFFCREYLRGRTPNPCILCNSDLKFGELIRYADSIGADHVATGHYARIRDGRLLKGLDEEKDQSYVLFNVRREVLPRVLLPLGEMKKSLVRAAARAAGLKTMDKAESQDICFVPGGDYRELLAARGHARRVEGRIVDTAGRVLGTHEGTERFTIGQRRGLSIAAGHPLYVLAIRPETQTVVVGEEEHLLSHRLVAKELNLLADLPNEFDCTARIRYAHGGTGCRVTLKGGEAHVSFREPVSAITPGQAVVFYDDDLVLGGGWIERS